MWYEWDVFGKLQARFVEVAQAETEMGTQANICEGALRTGTDHCKVGDRILIVARRVAICID